MALRIIQFMTDSQRFVGRITADQGVQLVGGAGDTVYELFRESLRAGTPFAEFINDRTAGDSLDYDPIYHNRGYTMLPPLDHPDPNHLFIAGTGLTHLGGVKDRDKLYDLEDSKIHSDSMKMFQRGLDGGKPDAGTAGIEPEWFSKGNGHHLRAHGEPLTRPDFMWSAGEEAEVVGAYVVGPDGTPHRLGMCIGNEFSDHAMEKSNYLYVAPSKLMPAAVGPELRIGEAFNDMAGTVTLKRDNTILWQADILTGDENMSHSLANLEHHHFKYDMNRCPGDIHLYFLGTPAISASENIALEAGDLMIIDYPAYGRPLINIYHENGEEPRCVTVNVVSG